MNGYPNTTYIGTLSHRHIWDKLIYHPQQYFLEFLALQFLRTQSKYQNRPNYYNHGYTVY